ncbi:hypothetical protein [Streptomyces sp. NBC_00158]|uniref:hypothetical protein n=1 Tax=Streptomyces sp. NBC_00158 TaxID=2903627 RepID=UPI003863DA46
MPRALGAGADDHVTKPFSMPELLARLGAVARRSLPERAAVTGEEVLESEEFTIGLLAMKARRGGKSIRLTAPRGCGRR